MYGQRIRQLRKEMKMTQEILAKKLNKAKSTISQYENEINEPDLETLSQMSTIFNTSIGYLSGKSNNRNEDDSNTYEYDYSKDSRLSPETIDLAEQIEKLPVEKQLIIRDIIRAYEVEKKTK